MRASFTHSTPTAANRAKNIVNKPVVNEDNNVRIIRELRSEIEQCVGWGMVGCGEGTGLFYH